MGMSTVVLLSQDNQSVCYYAMNEGMVD